MTPGVDYYFRIRLTTLPEDQEDDEQGVENVPCSIMVHGSGDEAALYVHKDHPGSAQAIGEWILRYLGPDPQSGV
jgi:hypothetical protein